MSLFRKILWRFVAIAALPFVILAGLQRWQTVKTVDAAAESELASDAAGAARLLARDVAVGEAALNALVELAVSDASTELFGQILETGVGPQPDGFRYLSILNTGSAPPTTVGDPVDEGVCRDGLYSSTVTMEVELRRGVGWLAGGFQPELQRSLHPDTELWVYDDEGNLVVATSCPPGPGLPSGTAAVTPTALVVEASLEGFDETVAMARVPSRDWTVIATRSSAPLVPFSGTLQNYWLFVAVLAGTAVFALSALIRPVAGSLKDLTHAAERVADGDLRPWFPPPSDDEVGRLTLALQNMADRLRVMMTRVDQSSRLAVLGKLSAYLAHEIRNPLSAVKMNLQRLDRWRQLEDVPDKYAEAIAISLREVDRLSTAVSNILQLSPNQPEPKRVVSLHELIMEAGMLLDRDFARHRVELRWDLNAVADRVLGAPGQLKGVIINLMLNALEAQPHGGKLLIRSRLVSGTTEAPDPHLELRFKDQGPGVAPEIRDRIFEPFFTTKRGGSGIGLALVSQTISDHAGDVFVDASSRLGEGAEFVVRLPLAAVVSPKDPGELAPQVAPWLLP